MKLDKIANNMEKAMKTKHEVDANSPAEPAIIKKMKGKPSVDVLVKKKVHNNVLLSVWKKRMESAARKVRKYRTYKRKYNEEIQLLVANQ